MTLASMGDNQGTCLRRGREVWGDNHVAWGGSQVTEMHLHRRREVSIATPTMAILTLLACVVVIKCESRTKASGAAAAAAPFFAGGGACRPYAPC